MIHPVPSVRDAIHYLEQGIDLLTGIDATAYVHKDPTYGSGIGCHMRHCLDHFDCFLRDFRSSKIDYDQRQRDPRLEVDREYAAEHIRSIIVGLADVQEEDMSRGVHSIMDCGSDDPEPAAHSSVKREVQFLVSHTLHHYALIAMQLKQQGLPPQDGFGMAPSTLRYRETKKPCAQ